MYKICHGLDLNREPLGLEASALPTGAHPSLSWYKVIMKRPRLWFNGLEMLMSISVLSQPTDTIQNAHTTDKEVGGSHLSNDTLSCLKFIFSITMVWAMFQNYFYQSNDVKSYKNGVCYHAMLRPNSSVHPYGSGCSCALPCLRWPTGSCRGPLRLSRNFDEGRELWGLPGDTDTLGTRSWPSGTWPLRSSTCTLKLNKAWVISY